MALSLLPMLLIERQLGANESSAILAGSKAFQVMGLFLGGLLTDYFGFRFVILLSYAMGFIGFTTLIQCYQPILIGAFASIAQLGSALFPASARAMVREMKSLELKKSLAWLRTASNLGQVVSSCFGILFGSLGLIIPFVLDGVTSLFALVIGFLTIKNPESAKHSDEPTRVEKGYFTYSLALAFFYFNYELGFLAFSGFAKLSLQGDGIRAFAVVLLINTLLCGLLAVPASRFFKNPKMSLGLGFSTVTSGMIAMTLLSKTLLNFAICATIMTIGEVIFSVYSQSLLLANSSGKTSRFYGLSLLIQSSGRFLAGAVLFPGVLKSENPSLPFLLGAILFFVFAFKLPREFLRRA